MKRTLVKLIYRFLFFIKYRVKVKKDDYKYNRKEPYFIIGNHLFEHDGLLQSIYLRKQPFVLVNELELTSKVKAYLYKEVLNGIVINKDQYNIIALKQIKQRIKENHSIMIFPEFESSLFGDFVPYSLSWAKLIKQQSIDLVVVNTKGAYLTHPRWGKGSVFKGKIELSYRLLMSKEKVKLSSVEEIHQQLLLSLEHDDFFWNQEEKYLYKPKTRAVGLENYIYYCPVCSNHQTIATKRNSINCSQCGEIARFNSYSLLSGLEFIDLSSWNQLQKNALPNILSQAVFTEGVMYSYDRRDHELTNLDRVDIEINPLSKLVFIQNRDEELAFDISKISSLQLIRKNEVVIKYKHIIYFLHVKDPMLLIDAILFLKKQ